jgi:DNA-binding transcriptional LysR family regulator
MISREILFHLPTFATVADTAGFTTAARRLGMTVSAVSQAIRALEHHIGAPLFYRTTRSVTLTEPGEALLLRARPLLRELAASVETASSTGRKPSGTLRLNVPRLAVPLVLEPILLAMRERHPDVLIEIFVDDRTVDIISEGFDAGIRMGDLADRDMITVRLTPPMRTILVASPAYVARKGRPRAIEDLARHDRIGFKFSRSGGVYDWELTVGDTIVEVTGRPALVVNDTIFNLTFALAGLGVAHIFESLAAPYIDHGLLIDLMPEHATEESPLVLYFPRYANEQPKLRAFIDVARSVTQPNRRSAPNS